MLLCMAKISKKDGMSSFERIVHTQKFSFLTFYSRTIQFLPGLTTDFVFVWQNRGHLRIYNRHLEIRECEFDELLNSVKVGRKSDLQPGRTKLNCLFGKIQTYDTEYKHMTECLIEYTNYMHLVLL